MDRHAHLLGTEEYLTTVTQFLLLRTYVAIFGLSSRSKSVN